MANRSQNLRNLISAALFAALVFAATVYMKLPAGNGYIHLGDGFIYLAASLLPAPFAVGCAVVGGGLADLLGGFPVWAPGTVVIKAAITPCFTARGKSPLCARNYIALAAALIITAGGYYLYEAVVINDFRVALAGIPFNLIQSAAGAAVYIVTAAAVRRLRKQA